MDKHEEMKVQNDQDDDGKQNKIQKKIGILAKHLTILNRTQEIRHILPEIRILVYNG